MGATPHRAAQASHHRGLSRCGGAQAPDAQAQQLWLTGPAAPRHVGSSQARARTHVSCISRQVLNHCATREAQNFRLLKQCYWPLLKSIEITFRERLAFRHVDRHQKVAFCRAEYARIRSRECQQREMKL